MLFQFQGVWSPLDEPKKFTGPPLYTSEITKRHLQTPSFPICLEILRKKWPGESWSEP